MRTRLSVANFVKSTTSEIVFNKPSNEIVATDATSTATAAAALVDAHSTYIQHEVNDRMNHGDQEGLFVKSHEVLVKCSFFYVNVL